MSVLHRVIGEEKDKYIICGDNTAVIEKIPKNKIAAKAAKLKRRSRVIDINHSMLKLMVRIWYGIGLKKTARYAKRKINKIQI